MSKIGYARVSSVGQSLDIQIERLKQQGCEPIFRETHTGTTDQRLQLQEMMRYLRKGDTLYITKLDRLGRSTLHLAQIFNTLEQQSIDIVVLDQDINTTTPTGKLLFNVLSSIAEFETQIRKERQIEGINKAKLNGVAFGRKAKLTLEQIKQLQVDRKNGMLVKDLMKKYNISKSSFYRLTTL